MSRMFVRFGFLLIALVISRTSLRAEEPAKPKLTKSGSGTLVLMGSNTYPGGASVTNLYGGGTMITAGTLQLTSPTTVNGGTLNFEASPIPYGVPIGGNTGTDTVTIANGTTLPYGITSIASGAPIPTTPISAACQPGKVFYLIIEGAGLGDNVRCFPCTGKETVLDAVSKVNGLSQLSSTKMWIARPSPISHDKSTILSIDWEAISKRGINTTNYTLMPGDRLVFGADPLTTRSNLLGKRTAIIERLEGVMGLTTSTHKGLNSMSPSEREKLEELVRKGVFTDDEEMKALLEQMIGPCEQEKKKAGPTAAAEQKPGQGEKRSNTAGPKATAEQQPRQGEEKLNAAGEAPPHELALRPLPAYRIEPPDVIQIEMLKLVPLPPYRAEIFDVQQIRANALPDHPINNYFMVQADGTIDLGPPYGSVHVAGKTKDEMCAALDKSLRKFVREPAVYVQLARVAGVQPVTGQYLVAPDGTINLRQYGLVRVAGKMVTEARIAIQTHLNQFLDSPELSVDVVAYNSKVYYIITQGAGLGDNVRRLPITGKETVLDAISQINGLSQVSSKNIWIIRPSASNPAKATILPVDWDGITARGATVTNYQVFPGDRVYIGEDPLITRTNLLAKKTAPIERLSGIVSLITSTLRGLDDASAADYEVLKNLVRKGVFTDDEEMKRILQEAIHARELEGKKAPSKAAENGK